MTKDAHKASPLLAPRADGSATLGQPLPFASSGLKGTPIFEYAAIFEYAYSNMQPIFENAVHRARFVGDLLQDCALPDLSNLHYIKSACFDRASLPLDAHVRVR